MKMIWHIMIDCKLQGTPCPDEEELRVLSSQPSQSHVHKTELDEVKKSTSCSNRLLGCPCPFDWDRVGGGKTGTQVFQSQMGWFAKMATSITSNLKAFRDEWNLMN